MLWTLIIITGVFISIVFGKKLRKHDDFNITEKTVAISIRLDSGKGTGSAGRSGEVVKLAGQ